MILNVYSSGVIFTYDLNDGSPYYVVNYDDKTGLTNTVTSGSNIYSNMFFIRYLDYIEQNDYHLLQKVLARF